MSWQDDGTYSKLFGEPKGELKRAKMSPKAKIAGASLSAVVLLTVAGTIALSGGRHDPADPAVDGAAGSDAPPPRVPDHAVPHASLNCPAVENGWAACSGHAPGSRFIKLSSYQAATDGWQRSGKQFSKSAQEGAGYPSSEHCPLLCLPGYMPTGGDYSCSEGNTAQCIPCPPSHFCRDGRAMAPCSDCLGGKTVASGCNATQNTVCRDRLPSERWEQAPSAPSCHNADLCAAEMARQSPAPSAPPGSSSWLDWGQSLIGYRPQVRAAGTSRSRHCASRNVLNNRVGGVRESRMASAGSCQQLDGGGHGLRVWRPAVLHAGSRRRTPG